MPVDVLVRPFLKELDFEKALADFLPQHGCEPNVIMNPTEETLVKNWAAIIYNNNRFFSERKSFFQHFSVLLSFLLTSCDSIHYCSLCKLIACKLAYKLTVTHYQKS